MTARIVTYFNGPEAWMDKHIHHPMVDSWIERYRTEPVLQTTITTSGHLLTQGDKFIRVRLGRAIVVGYGDGVGEARLIHYDVEGPAIPDLIIGVDEWKDFACWFRLPQLNRINDHLVIEPNPNIHQCGPWDRQVKAWNQWIVTIK